MGEVRWGSCGWGGSLQVTHLSFNQAHAPHCYLASPMPRIAAVLPTTMRVTPLHQVEEHLYEEEAKAEEARAMLEVELEEGRM